MGLLNRIKTFVASDKEKELSAGGGWDTREGYFPSTFTPGWFQQGYTPGVSKAYNPDVAAAISLYKRALMAVPAYHVQQKLSMIQISLRLSLDLTFICHGLRWLESSLMVYLPKVSLHVM
jgi:hypothetical protein